MIPSDNPGSDSIIILLKSLGFLLQFYRNVAQTMMMKIKNRCFSCWQPGCPHCCLACNLPPPFHFSQAVVKTNLHIHHLSNTLSEDHRQLESKLTSSLITLLKSCRRGQSMPRGGFFSGSNNHLRPSILFTLIRHSQRGRCYVAHLKIRLRI